MTVADLRTRQSRNALGWVALILVVVAAVAWGAWQRSNRERPNGIAQRVPWVTGRVVGSPDPPLPYRVERVFPKLTFTHPLEMAFEPGGNRIVVVEQAGKIYSFPNKPEIEKADVFLDLPGAIRGLDKVPFCKGIEAAYGFAFHPHFERNQYCFVCYTLLFEGKDHNQLGSRVSRFTVTGDPPRADPDSEVVMLEWPSGGHNGGSIHFGKDGFLYVSTGDSGDPNPPDPFDTGQRIDDLLSSICRIDVDHPDPGKTYGIPKDNPFLNLPGARGEVWAFGLRNPWRMSFDRETGELWVGDVGWELWEMVHRVDRGGNYGWSIMEGPNPVHPNEKPGPAPITPPQLSLNHTEAASITGGFMYHGKRFPKLRNQYVFGDWETRRLWAAPYDGKKLAPHRTIAQTDLRVVAFGEDAEGELTIVDYEGGGLWRMIPNEAVHQPQAFPMKLSETGLFDSVARQTPAPGVLPFEINAQQWVDGASELHFVAVPGEERASIGKGTWGDDKPMYPTNTVLVRTMSLPMRADDPSAARKVETQLLHFDGRQWHGYSYKWNDDQTDATLLPADGLDQPLTISDPSAPGGQRQQVWHFPSRAQCLSCHTAWTSYLLAFNEQQLDRPAKFAFGATDNEVRAFRAIGVLAPPLPPPSDPKDAFPLVKLANPYDESGKLDDRARSYLHVNCSHCHRFGGGGSALIDVRREMPFEKTGLVANPLLGGFNIRDPKIVFPGAPSQSVLFYRMSKTGNGRMPHIGSNVVDDRGLKLMSDWIEELANVMNSTEAADTQEEADLRAARAPSTPAALANQATDRLLSSTSGALRLVRVISSHALPEPVRQQIVSKGSTSPRPEVRDLFVRFTSQNANRLGSSFDRAKLLAMKGSADEGRKIFFESNGTGLCARCHIVNGKGADFGPDLSHIASKYKPADILENIVEPSKTIEPKYVTYLVQTTTGDVHQGFVISRTNDQIVLKDAELKQVRLPASEVKKIAPQTISAMPEGLLNDLEPQQAADLMAFLESLK